MYPSCQLSVQSWESNQVSYIRLDAEWNPALAILRLEEQEKGFTTFPTKGYLKKVINLADSILNGIGNS